MPTSTDPLLKRLLGLLEAELAQAVELRHALHEQPELAREERRTAALVAEALPVSCTAVAGTGRLARVGGSDTAPLAIRAELDGLPIHERTNAPYSARGETMHACGHDVHMAALVALMRAAEKISEELPAPLLAIFQPSEEVLPSGAQELLSAGLGEPAPAAVLAAHVHPELPWGSVGLDAGTVNASSDSVEITVEGEPSHGAYPHLGRACIAASTPATGSRGAAADGRGGRRRHRLGARLPRQLRADRGRAGAGERRAHRRRCARPRRAGGPLDRPRVALVRLR
jgi:amidohydrolase